MLVRAALLALGLTAAPAMAATSYSVLDFGQNGLVGTFESVTRGLWTGNFVRRNDGTSEGAKDLAWDFTLWTLSNSTLVVDGANSRLTGRATNRGDAGLQMDFDISLIAGASSAGQPGYCQYGGGPQVDCADFAGQVDPSTWDYFNVGVGSTMTGVAGTAMAGLSLSIGDVTGGNHLPQMGIGANAFDMNDLGFSSWMSWTASGSAADTSQYIFATSSDPHLDFNVDLIENVNNAEVPLPAGLVLLLGGLATFAGGAAAKRRRAA